jgi:hypothetical protein
VAALPHDLEHGGQRVEGVLVGGQERDVVGGRASSGSVHGELGDSIERSRTGSSFYDR